MVFLEEVPAYAHILLLNGVNVRSAPLHTGFRVNHTRRDVQVKHRDIGRCQPLRIAADQLKRGAVADLTWTIVQNRAAALRRRKRHAVGIHLCLGQRTGDLRWQNLLNEGILIEDDLFTDAGLKDRLDSRHELC